MAASPLRERGGSAPLSEVALEPFSVRPRTPVRATCEVDGPLVHARENETGGCYSASCPRWNDSICVAQNRERILRPGTREKRQLSGSEKWERVSLKAHYSWELRLQNPVVYVSGLGTGSGWTRKRTATSHCISNEIISSREGEAAADPCVGPKYFLRCPLSQDLQGGVLPGRKATAGRTVATRQMQKKPLRDGGEHSSDCACEVPDMEKKDSVGARLR